MWMFRAQGLLGQVQCLCPFRTRRFQTTTAKEQQIALELQDSGGVGVLRPRRRQSRTGFYRSEAPAGSVRSRRLPGEATASRKNRDRTLLRESRSVERRKLERPCFLQGLLRACEALLPDERTGEAARDAVRQRGVALAQTQPKRTMATARW